MRTLISRVIEAFVFLREPTLTVASLQERHLPHVDFLVGIPFGSHAKAEKPSFGANMEIAIQMAALQNSELFGFPPVKVAQWEIAQALEALGETCRVTSGHEHDPHINTAEFFAHLRNLVGTDVIRIAIVAHPDHALRCRMVAERHGFDVVFTWWNNITYHSDSTQWWTRSPWLFWPWEMCSRAYFLIRGWM